MTVLDTNWRWRLISMIVLAGLLTGCIASPGNMLAPTAHLETSEAQVEAPATPEPLQTTQAANATRVFETATALDGLLATVNSAPTQNGISETVSALNSLLATASSVPTPTKPPPTLSLDPGEVPQIETLCLQIDQAYPQIDDEFAPPFRETAEAILTGLGIVVVEVGDACDATLHFSVTGEALWFTPWGSRKCYNGASVIGQVILKGLASEEQTRSISGIKPVPLYNNVCNYIPADAPWEQAWTGALLEGLVAVWGQQVLFTALTLPDLSHYQAVAIADTAAELESDQALDVLLYMLELEDSYQFAHPHVIVLLGTYDTEAETVVPVLIEALNDEDVGVRATGAEALYAITGQDFGGDADAWQAWWEEQ